MPRKTFLFPSFQPDLLRNLKGQFAKRWVGLHPIVCKHWLMWSIAKRHTLAIAVPHRKNHCESTSRTQIHWSQLRLGNDFRLQSKEECLCLMYSSQRLSYEQ